MQTNLGRKQTFNWACHEKQCDNTPHSQHAQIKEMPPKTTSERKILETKWSLYLFCKMCFRCVCLFPWVSTSPFLLQLYFLRFGTFDVRGMRFTIHCRTIQRQPECFNNHTEMSIYSIHGVQIPDYNWIYPTWLSECFHENILGWCVGSLWMVLHVVSVKYTALLLYIIFNTTVRCFCMGLYSMCMHILYL